MSQHIQGEKEFESEIRDAFISSYKSIFWKGATEVSIVKLKTGRNVEGHDILFMISYFYIFPGYIGSIWDQ